MSRLYSEVSHDLVYKGIEKAFRNKWHRNDVLCTIEEWTGFSRYELLKEEHKNGQLTGRLKYRIIDELALAVEDIIDGIRHGVDPDLESVQVRKHPDGATGKVRDIAYLSELHQILGHIVFLGLEKLFHARLLQTQHASIPKRGQTRLARQVRRMLNRKLGITCYVKTDCSKAYASVTYDLCIKLIAKEIPRAKWIHDCLRVLQRMAPDGHLIIGGFLDAWLFNYVMSYALREILSMKKTRRGKCIPMVKRAVTFMDDMLLLGNSRAALLQAVKRLSVWINTEFGMSLRTTTDVIKLYKIEEEKAHRRMETPAKRSVPMVDMGGYKVGRTFITVRRRNVMRMIHSFQRAWDEICRTGTLKRQRARQIIARNGLLENSSSYHFREKYHVPEVMKMARHVQAYWGREENRRRKERVRYAVERHEKQCAALCGAC